MNTKQQALLEEVHHNVAAIGRFLIEALTPKRKKEDLVPRVKRKNTLEEMIVQVLSESDETVNATQLRKEVRSYPYQYGQNHFPLALKKLLKKGDIRVGHLEQREGKSVSFVMSNSTGIVKAELTHARLILK
jgi:hypothetical protein